MKKTIGATALLSLMLSACSGSENGSTPALGAASGDDLSAAPYTDYATGSGNENLSPPVTETSQLNVDDTFLFRSAANVSFTVDVEAARGKESYLSICPDFEPVGSGYSVNYDSCLVKAPMSNGRYEANLLIPNQHDDLIGVVWPAVPGDDPIYVEIDITDALEQSRRG